MLFDNYKIKICIENYTKSYILVYGYMADISFIWSFLFFLSFMDIYIRAVIVEDFRIKY